MLAFSEYLLTAEHCREAWDAIIETKSGVVLNQEQLCPPGRRWQYLETLWAVLTEEGGCCWHLVGGGWRRCQTSYSAQEGPPTDSSGPECQ